MAPSRRPPYIRSMLDSHTTAAELNTRSVSYESNSPALEKCEARQSDYWTTGTPSKALDQNLLLGAPPQSNNLLLFMAAIRAADLLLLLISGVLAGIMCRQFGVNSTADALVLATIVASGVAAFSLDRRDVYDQPRL